MKSWAVFLVVILGMASTAKANSPEYYGFVDGGFRMVSNEDYNATFDYSRFGYTKPNFPSSSALTFGIGAGYFITPNFGLELGYSGGPTGSSKRPMPRLRGWHSIGNRSRRTFGHST